MEFAGAEVVGRGNSIHVKHGDDSGLIVRFYFNKLYDKHYVKINVPGDSKTSWDRPVKEEDKRRFARQWEAFHAQLSQFGGQTMLEDWGLLNEAQVNSLRSFNVFTVENLADMQDGLVDRLGVGSRELNKKAKAWLQEQKERHNEVRLQEEIAKRDTKLNLQQEKLEALQKQIDALAQAQSTPAPKERGRPRKETQNDNS